MARFSERYGHVPVRSALQVNDLDEETRLFLWNTLYPVIDAHVPGYAMETNGFVRMLWAEYLKRPLDTIPYSHQAALTDPLKAAVVSGPFYQVMDLVELLVEWQTESYGRVRAGLQERVNGVMERFLVGYRIIEGEAVPVSSESEVNSIERALEQLGPYTGARDHLERALSLLSDRQNPRYADSLTQSIHAVESVAKMMTGETTLGAALNCMRKKGEDIHPALLGGWSKIYGYTSDADGIRHGSIDPSDVDEALATYFLVACSAFIGLLIKVHEAS